MERPTHGTTAEAPLSNYRQRYTGPDGERHSTTDVSAREVQQKAALELSQLIEAHAARNAKGQTATRFDLFAEEWLQSRRPEQPGGYSPVVYRKRINHVRALNETFGRRFIEDIAVRDVSAWWNTRADTPCTARTCTPASA